MGRLFLAKAVLSCKFYFVFRTRTTVVVFVAKGLNTCTIKLCDECQGRVVQNISG